MTRLQAAALLALLSLASLGVGCGDGAVTSPTAVSLAGTVWTGPFTDTGLGSGTMTMTIGGSAPIRDSWFLSRTDFDVSGSLRVIPRSATDPLDVVTLGLGTALLDPNCDMLLTARVTGSQMIGEVRLGRCHRDGERQADIRFSRR